VTRKLTQRWMAELTRVIACAITADGAKPLSSMPLRTSMLTMNDSRVFAKVAGVATEDIGKVGKWDTEVLQEIGQLLYLK
jgi:hypothetical protein